MKAYVNRSMHRITPLIWTAVMKLNANIIGIEIISEATRVYKNDTDVWRNKLAFQSRMLQSIRASGWFSGDVRIHRKLNLSSERGESLALEINNLGTD